MQNFDPVAAAESCFRNVHNPIIQEDLEFESESNEAEDFPGGVDFSVENNTVCKNKSQNNNGI